MTAAQASAQLWRITSFVPLQEQDDYHQWFKKKMHVSVNVTHRDPLPVSGTPFLSFVPCLLLLLADTEVPR